MIWCLIALAILMALSGLAALTLHPSRQQLGQVRPGRLLRGCLALFALLAALGLLGLALLLAQR